jgi:hypothetical protein
MVLVASFAQAQTAVTPQQNFAWDHDGVNLQTQQVCVDGTCVAVPGANTVRSVPMPAMTPGAHALTVKSCNAAGCRESAPFQVTLVVLPAPATNLRVTAPPAQD